MPGTTDARVFVSFASEDKGLADAVVSLLRLGCNLGDEQVFYTARPGTLVPGRSFTQAIRSALESSVMSIHLLTPAYYRSKFCLAELGAVWAAGGERIPFVVPPLTVADL